MLKLIFALLVACLCIGTSSAWFEKAHMMVVQIAKLQLSDAHVKLFQDHLDTFTYDGMYSKAEMQIVPAAVWMDTIKNNGFRAFNSFHYVDYPILDESWPFINDSIKVAEVQAVNMDLSLIGKITLLEQSLTTHDLTTFSRTLSLLILIHIMGDLHQPLHSAQLYSSIFPNGDYGGNIFRIVTSDPSINEMHAFWDCGALQFEENNWRMTELETQLGLDYILDHSQRIIEEYPIDSFDPIELDFYQPNALDNWFNETYTLAKNVVYKGVNSGDTLTDEYILNAQQIIRKQIAKGGYRLGLLLTSVFNEAPGGVLINNEATEVTTGDKNEHTLLVATFVLLFFVLVIQFVMCIVLFRRRGHLITCCVYSSSSSRTDVKMDDVTSFIPVSDGGESDIHETA